MAQAKARTYKSINKYKKRDKTFETIGIEYHRSMQSKCMGRNIRREAAAYVQRIQQRTQTRDERREREHRGQAGRNVSERASNLALPRRRRCLCSPRAQDSPPSGQSSPACLFRVSEDLLISSLSSPPFLPTSSSTSSTPPPPLLLL